MVLVSEPLAAPCNSNPRPKVLLKITLLNVEMDNNPPEEVIGQ